MAVTYTSNFLYRFFTATEIPELFAITGFYIIMEKNLQLTRNPFSGTFSLPFRNSACINLLNQAKLAIIIAIPVACIFVSGGEMEANTSVSFVLHLFHSFPEAYGAYGSRVFDRSKVPIVVK